MSRTAWGATFVAAFIAANVARIGALAPLIVAGVLVVVQVLVMRWFAGRPLRSGDTRRELAGPLTISWLVLTLLPAHNFAARSGADAVSAIGVQPVIELLVFCGVGVFAVATIRRLEPTLAVARPPVVLFLLPVWIVTTSTWSATGIYAFVRGTQLVVLATLAWATLSAGRRDPALVDDLLELFSRWFLRITLVLCAFGLAFGPLFVAVAGSNAGRFSWVGAHPNESGLVLSVAIVIVFAAPSAMLRLTPLTSAAVGAGLVFAMYANHSRTAWLCLAVGLAVTFVLRGRVTKLLHWTGAPLIGVGVIAALWLRGPEIWDYLLRDRDSDNLASGNGRKELWSIGARALETPFDWIAGLGYGITRTVFVDEAPWASDAHNSVLALLVSGGLVAVFLLLVTLVWSAAMLLRTGPWLSGPTGVLAISLAAVVLVNGLATDIVAEPKIGLVVVFLVAACAAAIHEGRWRGAVHAPSDVPSESSPA